jgi:hypothetical protein
MDLKLQTCEGCNNIITLDPVNFGKTIYDCPLCGTLNTLKEEEMVEVTITSPSFDCELKANTKSTYIISSMSEEEKDAMSLLSSKGWNIKFSLVSES